jgi:hypothetical protein
MHGWHSLQESANSIDLATAAFKRLGLAPLEGDLLASPLWLAVGAGWFRHNIRNSRTDPGVRRRSLGSARTSIEEPTALTGSPDQSAVGIPEWIKWPFGRP